MTYKKKKIIAIIPAKKISTELKNKNLLKINKNSLVEIAVNICKKSKYIDYIVISSDSEIIINLCLKAGADNYIKRPQKISKKNSNILLAWQHAIKSIRKKTNINFDYTILVEPTCPLRKVETLDGSIKKIIDNNLNYLITVSKVQKKFHPFKQFNIRKNLLKPFSNSNIKIINRQELDYTYSKNGIAYIGSIPYILRSRTLNYKYSGFFETNYPIVNIDNLEDYEQAKLYMKRL